MIHRQQKFGALRSYRYYRTSRRHVIKGSGKAGLLFRVGRFLGGFIRFFLLPDGIALRLFLRRLLLGGFWRFIAHFYHSFFCLALTNAQHGRKYNRGPQNGERL